MYNINPHNASNSLNNILTFPFSGDEVKKRMKKWTDTKNYVKQTQPSLILTGPGAHKHHPTTR